ncbi:MTMR14 isoform 7 [Pan troglodytes]|uniref:MTMR14 isoform 7 n=1 Tax=Pan troglodytes TaxID=9598 RepID=A0A2J8M0U0_PANTR|nr:MTMR14 isoform 7 [Pan troglodytes]
MAGARAAAAAASAGSSASSGNQPPQEPGLGELLEEFSRTQYRAKDGSGTGGSKVERIEKRCLELFGRDYCFSVIPNTNGDICGHYPRHIVFLEYESSEKEKDTFESTVQGVQMMPGQMWRTSRRRTVLFEVVTRIFLIRSEAMTSSCFDTCQSNTSVT